jgi:hypothetical protein
MVFNISPKMSPKILAWRIILRQEHIYFLIKITAMKGLLKDVISPNSYMAWDYSMTMNFLHPYGPSVYSL